MTSVIVATCAVLRPSAGAGHVRRQIPEAGQRGAGGEAGITDLPDVPAALDGAQLRAAAEHTVAKFYQGIGQRDALERDAVHAQDAASKRNQAEPNSGSA